MSFFLFLPFTILCVYTGACEETSGKKENVKCSAAFLLRKYICQNQNITSCTALQKIWHGKFLWYFIAASLTTNIFGECYLHVAFLNVSLWTKKRKGFWRKGMPVILPPDLVWKPDCFSDIQAPEAAESQTTVLYPTALMFEEFILFLSPEIFLWNKLRLSESINYCPLSQFHKQKSRKEPKKLQVSRMCLILRFMTSHLWAQFTPLGSIWLFVFLAPHLMCVSVDDGLPMAVIMLTMFFCVITYCLLNCYPEQKRNSGWEGALSIWIWEYFDLQHKLVEAEPDNSTVMHFFVRHYCAWFCQTNGGQPGFFVESFMKRPLQGLGKELPWAWPLSV